MGKALVIKGADFSANALGKSQTALEYFISQMNLQIESRQSIGISSSTEEGYSTLSKSISPAESRARIWSLDIGLLVSAGFTEVEFTPNSDWNYIFACGYDINQNQANATIYTGDKSVGTWSWNSGKTIAPINSTNSKLYIHFKRADGATVSEILSIEDIFESILVR